MLAVALIALMAVPEIDAQQAGAERLPRTVLDVVPPSDRVRGVPGEMTIRPAPCRVLPSRDTRRRIVDVAVQEWAFFGFRIVDQTEVDNDAVSPRETPGAGGGAPNV